MQNAAEKLSKRKLYKLNFLLKESALAAMLMPESRI
jgi:hypothetical protein